MNYEQDSLRSAAEQVAGLLSSAEGQDLLVSLQRLGLGGLANAATALAPSLRRTPAPAIQNGSHHLAPPNGPIGPWAPMPDGQGGIKFVRRDRPGAQAFPYPVAIWADSDSFALKSRAHRRVVLVGESVARGFVLDPVITPAALLQEALDPSQSNETEVIDLACTGISGQQLLGVVRQSMQLKPEVLVLFAGNNWWNFYWGLRDHSARHSMLGKSIADIRSQIEESLATFAQRLLQSIASLCNAHGVKLVLVIPEFNLLDWFHEELTPVWISDSALAEWLRQSDLAKTHLAALRGQEMIEAATTMVSLDGGLSAYSLELLARAHLIVGDFAAALRYLEDARDAACWSCEFGTPKCPSVVQEQMRKLGVQYPSVGIVDLPRLLRRNSTHGLPSADYFIDYVHMSPAGLTLAMQAVAIELTGRASAVVGKQASTPTHAAQLAPAYFFAALHNQHYGQPDATIERLLALSVECNREYITSMVDFIEEQASPFARGLRAEFVHPQDPAERRFLEVFTFKAGSDTRLRHCVARLARKVGSPYRSDFLTTPLLQVGDTARLTRSRLEDARYPSTFALRDSERLFTVERQKQTAFRLRLAAGCDLEITARVPWANSESDEVVHIVCNGVQTSVSLGDRWRTVRIAPLDAARETTVAVDLLVLWPLPSLGAQQRRFSDDLKRAEEAPSFFVEFGHVAALRAVQQLSVTI